MILQELTNSDKDIREYMSNYLHANKCITDDFIYEKAKSIAKNLLSGVPRKYGDTNGYDHSLRVATMVAMYPCFFNKDVHVKAIKAALLHDVLEDGGITEDELIQLYPEINKTDTLYYIRTLTNDEDEIKRKGYVEYMTNRMMFMPEECLLIKLCDILDNMLHTKSAKFIHMRMKVVLEVRRVLLKSSKDAIRASCLNSEWNKDFEEIVGMMARIWSSTFYSKEYVDRDCFDVTSMI